MYCSPTHSDNNTKTSTTSSKYIALSFRAISLRSSTRVLNFLSVLRDSTRDLAPPHIREPRTCQTFTFTSCIAVSFHFKTKFPSKHAMPTSRHCCHNLYLVQLHALQLHSSRSLHDSSQEPCRYQNTKLPNFSNTVPHERSPKHELPHVLVRSFASQTHHQAYNCCSSSLRHSWYNNAHTLYKTTCPRTPPMHTLFHQASLHICNPDNPPSPQRH